jgi:predicted transcriptional regulator
MKKKFFRGAGAIAGVVLEKHLKQVIENHNLSTKKKHPSIADYNDLLKKEEIIGTKNWRFIQHLGDLRNLCDHNKDKEPTNDDIQSLIDGIKKIIKTIW